MGSISLKTDKLAKRLISDHEQAVAPSIVSKSLAEPSTAPSAMASPDMFDSLSSPVLSHPIETPGSLFEPNANSTLGGSK